MPRAAERRARSRAGSAARLLVAALTTAWGLSPLVSPVQAADPMVPLTALGSGTYQGRQGGLYPGGLDSVPGDHQAAGLQRAAEVQPLDPAGVPSPTGRHVLLSIGYSNAADQWCSRDRTVSCDPGTFMSRAAADPDVDRERLVIVNGAIGAQDAPAWADRNSPNYGTVAGRLADAGVTAQQVQVVWFKTTILAGESPDRPRLLLPDPNATAYQLVTYTSEAIRTLKATYPNLRQVFVSSRIFGGWSDDPRVNEPVSYETGFGVKWTVQAQIEQMRNGGAVVDARAGDLNHATGRAPWIAWGPYMWAPGTTPRADGLVWPRSDFVADGVHPSPTGVAKAGAMLLDFFKTSPLTRDWFLAGAPEPPPPPPPPPPPDPAEPTVYGFDDFDNRPALDGVRAGIDFGTGRWFWHGGWRGVPTVANFSEPVASRSFTLPAGTGLVSVRLVTMAPFGSTYTLVDSSGVNPPRTGVLAYAVPATVDTGWAAPGATVTLTFSNGAGTLLDEIAYAPRTIPPPPPPPPEPPH